MFHRRHVDKLLIVVVWMAFMAAPFWSERSTSHGSASHRETRAPASSEMIPVDVAVPVSLEISSQAHTVEPAATVKETPERVIALPVEESTAQKDNPRMKETDKTTTTSTTTTASFAAIKAKYLSAFQEVQRDYILLGTSDSENLIRTLALMFEKRVLTAQDNAPISNFRLIMDIGANVGRTTFKLINAHSDHVCRREAKLTHDAVDHEACVREDRDAVVFSFEPLSTNFESVREKSVRYGWDNAQWVGVRAAVGSKTGEVTFFTSGKAGDEQASQNSDAALGGTNSVTVPMLALDTLFYGTDALPSDLVTAGTFSILKGLRSSPANIFLLKVDAEGYDYDILDGASTLLAAHRVKFLSFEYNDKWFTNGRTRTLKDVTTQLHDKFGYQCHWITPAQLIPLSGVWWSEEYECRMWSNVFCGVKGDEDLDVVRDVYARMGGRYSGK